MTASSGLRRAVREEVVGFHPRLVLTRAALSLIPPFCGGRARAALLRFAGFRVGRGTLICGTPVLPGPLTPRSRFVIGSGCVINVGCVFDIAGEIVIGDRAHIGQQVALLTQSHELGNAAQRAARVVDSAVRIGDGAWLGARCTILPGVSIGEGAVVAAGAVVTQSVAPNTLVGGVPAMPIRDLEAIRR